MTRIAVAVPWSSPFVWSRFAEAALAVRTPAATEVRWFFGKGWCPARRHTDATEKALAWGAHLICFFGADQVPPPDLLERLYAHVLDGKSAICALVPSRGYFAMNKDMKPFQAMAWRWAPQDPFNPKPYRGQQLDPDMIEVVVQDGTTQRVHMIGSGCLMFHVDHLPKRPWFFESFDPVSYKRFANMDTRFSWRLQEEGGATLWCDTSIKIRHLHAFEIDESFQDRFDDWMTPGPGLDPELVQFMPVKA